MNWEMIEGQWKGVKGKIREKWAKITDDDLELIGGKKDRLLGKLQEHYGLQKDKAERELDQFIRSMDSSSTKH